MPRTWILTGSPENRAATRDRGFGFVEDRAEAWPKHLGPSETASAAA